MANPRKHSPKGNRIHLGILGKVSLGILAAGTTVLSRPAVAQVRGFLTASIAQAQSSSIFDMSETHLTAISIVFSTIGGAAVYLVNESWKRRQYIEEKIKDFETSLETINVRKMLSAELQCIELFPFVDKAMERFVIVEDCLWTEAILACKCNYTLKEEYHCIDREKPLYLQDPAVKSCIRDNFNRFLHHLQHFEKMIQAGALDKEKLRSYLYPWFETIKEIGTSESVECPATKQQYTQHTALLEYMGLLDTVPDDQLSIVQKDVRALVTRYRSLSSFLENRSSNSQPASVSGPCPAPEAA